MTGVGESIAIAIEKPAAGGRMIGRLNGQIVLVSGAIPGERVTARVERVGKGVVYASAISIDEPSADRRDAFGDLLCGGCLYAHIAYPRQLELKGQVIVDAFSRIGRLPLERAPVVRPSKEDGYRMRARLHVAGGRAGFYREGTHEVCDARSTRQLLPETQDAVDRFAAGLASLGYAAESEVEVSENVSASERVLHLESASRVNPRPLRALANSRGVTGLTFGDSVLGGDAYVSDALSVGSSSVTLRRHVRSFFQGNRYLLGDLVGFVTGEVDQGSSVIDLYAGVGLFSVAVASAKGAKVLAVEGNGVSADDLVENARVVAGDVEVVRDSVEALLDRPLTAPDAVIVDPPRTGLSKEAMEGVIRLRARRMVYVSCDVATLARDCRKLTDVGYTIQRLEAFDMFPNTPHIETVVTLAG